MYSAARDMVGSLKMNTALEYSKRVVQEGGRRCKKSALNDFVHLTPLTIPFKFHEPANSVCVLCSVLRRKQTGLDLWTGFRDNNTAAGHYVHVKIMHGCRRNFLLWI